MSSNFISELIKRLATENPKFFKYIQLAAIGLAAFSASMKYINGGIALPWFIEWIKDNSVLIGSIVTTIMAQLPNTCPICQQKEKDNEKNNVPPGTLGVR